MIDVVEDKRNEFKIKLTDSLEKEVISFFEDGKGKGTLFAEVVTQWKQ